MRLMALGTSSGRPTRDRHVSAFAVDVEGAWILIDCGDGTQHQVLLSPLKPSRLHTVLITHLHGDHALGLPALLATMGLDGRTAPLHLIGPRGLGAWLEATTALPLLHIDFPLELTELDETDFANGPSEIITVRGHVVDALPLRHRVPSFGFRISETARSGRSLAVFGDTTPCANGVRLAADVDLLVHEATYTEAHADLAERFMHSTASQAAAVAAEARARRVHRFVAAIRDG